MLNTKIIDEMIKKGLEERIFPGAAISIGNKSGELFRKIYGFRQIFPQKHPMESDTLFDIASLTKIFTSIVALKLIQDGSLSLSDTLGKFFDAPSDKAKITIAHLMTHTSGLPAHEHVYNLVKEPSETFDFILSMKLLDEPGKAVVYSCLGYILLGRICEILGGNTIENLAKRWIFEPLGLESTAYNPEKNHTFAVTELDTVTNTWLDGVVHDENARFLKGISGNAGIFANIDDMATFAMMLANKGTFGDKVIIEQNLFEEAIKNLTAHCPEGRGLGFEIKSNTLISCGNVFSVGSYGHTGFTGTSLWVDIETGLYVVFMSNRVHPTRENVKHIPFRRELHDLCATEYKKVYRRQSALLSSTT